MNQKYMDTICYIILFNREDLTYFNKYDRGILKKTEIFEKISSFPKDLYELFFSKENIIRNRIGGLFDGYCIKFISNCEEIEKSPFDINVVFISSILDIDKINREVIFVSDELLTDINRKIYNINDINKIKLLKLVSDLISTLSLEKRVYFRNLRCIAHGKEKSEFLKLEEKFIKNIYTKSNLILLKSMKIDCDFDEYGFNFQMEYQERIIECIKFIKHDVCKNIPLSIMEMLPNIDFIISDMSSNLEFLINKDEFSANALAHKGFGDGRLLEKTIKLINQNKIENNVNENQYISIYVQERNFIESLIALKSSGNIAINIKLPWANSLFFSKLKDIGIVDRSNNRNKINILMSKLLSEFEINNWYDNFDKKYSSNIKVVSNLPVEWSWHNGLPLMVRHEVSRIPVSPGIVSTKLLLDSEQVFLKKCNFKNIKIISSFADSDPIKEDLSKKVNFINNELKLEYSTVRALLDSNSETKGIDIEVGEEGLDISIDWVNVNTLQELSETLAHDDSAITIFDLHGSHDVKGNGVIILKDETVSVYDLVGKVRISPIVILSSCDTSPIDRNHYTIANAFFLAGAKTVLASALPIQSHEASIFIARLLLRIKYYLPKRLDDVGISIRWSSVVTGMIRKTFYSELISMLQKKFGLDAGLKKNLNFSVGQNLDPLDNNWHEKIIEKISMQIGIPIDKLKNLIRTEFMMPECIKYIQLGNPELIVIAAEKHISLKAD